MAQESGSLQSRAVFSPGTRHRKCTRSAVDRRRFIMLRQFKDLNEREILALAISLEEEDARIYGDFADGLREEYPATAKLFDTMIAEESGHRQRLIAIYRQRFGEHIPLIRRHDVSGFVHRRPVWLIRPLGINAVRKQV